MLDLQSHLDGTILPVRAQPGARRNEVRGIQDGALKVCVTQAPEKGKANNAIAEVLAKWLGVKKSQVALLAGETASQKKFLVRGIEEDDLAQRIAARLAEPGQSRTRD
jgi:uncharacterized protein